MLRKILNYIKSIFVNKYTRWFVKTRTRKIITAVIILLIVFSRVNAARKPDFEVDTHVVSRSDFTESISAAGEVKAEKSSDLSFVAAELIDEIYVTDGSWVKKGEPIAKLNTTNLYHNLKIADENLRSAAASLDSVYDDLKDKENSETFEEIATRTAAEKAKNNAVFAQIQAQRNLSLATIRAPFDGIVDFKEGVSVGEYASAVTPSFTITDPSTVYFEAEVSELEVPKLNTGMKAIVELDAYSEEIFTEVLEVIGYTSTVTQSGGTAYKTRITLTQMTDDKFRLGMNGDVELVISEREGIISIPISALVEEDDGEYVWVVGDGGKVTERKVEVGADSTNDIEILSGIEENEIIVIRPPSELADGDKVSSE